MNKLKLILLLTVFMENKITSMYNPVNQVVYKPNTEQISDNLANNMNTVENGQQKIQELVLYKIFTYVTFIGVLGLFIITFVNLFLSNTKEVTFNEGICNLEGLCTLNLSKECSRDLDCNILIEESTKSTLGLILQLLLGLASGLSICLKVGFNCTFASILKLIIVVYGLLLGALSLAGEFIPVPTLAGLTGNENNTTAGIVVGFLDVGLSVVGLFMTIAYHYVSSTSSRYQGLNN